MSELQAKVCHHDAVVVHWEGVVEDGLIKCKDCDYVFWDKKATISFADAMAELLKEYDEE